MGRKLGTNMNIGMFRSRFRQSPIPRYVVVFLFVLACSIPAFCGKIHDAVEDGDLEKVKALLKKNPKLIWSRDVIGYMTPLGMAAAIGNRRMAELLLANKAEIDARNENGETPLFEAAYRGHKEVVELLLSNHAEIDARNYDGETPLYRAVGQRHKDIVELLLVHGANVDASDKWGSMTPLLLATDLGNMEMMALLLAHGADVNAKYNGRTPLLIAVGYSRDTKKDMLELLLAHGADVNVTNNKGKTPLCIAAMKNHRNAVDSLLAHGGNKNIEGDNLIALYVAAIQGDLVKTRELLKSNPALVFRKDKDGQTFLHWTAEFGYKDIVELLLVMKADVGAKDDVYGNTPLHKAANKSITELLLANKAEIDATNKWGHTPLHEAAIHGLKDVVESLLAKGAAINAKSHDGYTPLYWAAWQGRKEVAELLLTMGAEVNTENNNGSTPLHIAASFNHKDIAELLLAKGGNINARTNSGRTPLHGAAGSIDKSRIEIIEYLLTKGADANARDNEGRTPLPWTGPSNEVLKRLSAQRGPKLPAVRSKLLDANGNFTLYVSNASFAISPVDVRVEIDGELVVSDYFDVVDQHRVEMFRLSLSKGKHKIQIWSEKGGAQLKTEFEYKDHDLGVIEYWYYPKSHYMPTPKQFSFRIQRPPFLIR
jgi:ankyrin repeat protein